MCMKDVKKISFGCIFVRWVYNRQTEKQIQNVNSEMFVCNFDCFCLVGFFLFSRLRIEVTHTHQLCKQTLTLTVVCVSLRSRVSSNMALIKLQKQLDDRWDAVTELEGRFVQR